jgi:peptide-methionine (S)-S-oxide reductase
VGFSDGAEVVQVDYDSRVVSFKQLLDVFWRSHNPTGSNGSRLYQKAVFYHGLEQQKQAKDSLKSISAKLGRPVTSTIEPVRFRLARQADQKYYLRHNASLWREFLSHYSDSQDIVNSAAAAKVNGYLGGHSDQVQFQAFAPRLGVSESSLERLSRSVPKKAKHHLPKCSLPARDR